MCVSNCWHDLMVSHRRSGDTHATTLGQVALLSSDTYDAEIAEIINLKPRRRLAL